MRENLHRCEAEVERYRNEKEDMASNLASVEAVKEFLVTRVRDAEAKIKEQEDEREKVARKNATDQEVIAFLDARVKELEREAAVAKKTEEELRLDVVTKANKNEKKLRVLSDMLRFEREQMSVSEKEWKTEKKVLVKEVKSCRARIMAMEADQETCERENAQLREGLMALTHSGSSSPSRKPRKVR